MLITLCNYEGDSLFDFETEAVPRPGDMITIESQYAQPSDWSDEAFQNLKELEGQKLLVKAIHHRVTVARPDQRTPAVFVLVENVAKILDENSRKAREQAENNAGLCGGHTP